MNFNLQILKIANLLRFIIFCWYFSAQAQNNIYVQQLSTEQGLSQNTVMAISQDSLGFMWVGTRDGLNEYSGNKIKIYKHILGDTLSIAGNHINDIANGKKGNIWVAHNKGISLLCRKKGSFTNYEIGESDNREIRSISVIDEEVWACGWTGIYKYDAEKNRFTKPEIVITNVNLADIPVAKVVKSPFRNEYWIASATKGLFKYDPISKNGIQIKDNSTDITLSENERIEDILFHPNGKIYIATYNNGIYQLDSNGIPEKHWSFSSEEKLIAFGSIRTLALNTDGNIWVGGFQGVRLLDPKTGVVQEVNTFHNTHLIDSPSVRSLYIDKNSSLWIGTYHDGLLLSDEYLSRFTPHPLNTQNHKNSHNIASAFTYKKGNLIVATENGYLIEYDKSYNTIRTNRIENGAVIKSLFYDSATDILWIGTLRKGLYKEHNDKITAVGLANLGVINNILKESDDKLWILSDKSGGLNLFDIKTNQLTDFPIAKKLHPFIGKNFGKHLLKINNTTYLLSTIGKGLILFENSTGGKIEQKIEQVDDVNHVLAIGEKYFVSTDGFGVFVLDKHLEIVENYTTKDGLLNNTIFSIMASGEDLWVNSINGVSQFANGVFLNYHIRNGFPISEINQGATFCIHSNPIVFAVGGKDLWVSFEPQKVSKNQHRPKVYLSEIKVNNQPISSISKLENISVIHPEEIELAHNQTALTLEFTSLNYLMPENSRFKYILEGFDIDWRYSSEKGIIEYSKIPKGSYIFKIQASNNDGVWGEQLSFPIVVKPPFWLTFPAFIIYFLVIFIIIWYIRRNMLRRIVLNHRIRLKEIEKKRVEEMHSMKVKYFTDVSHEILTPLTLILSPVEEILEETELQPKVRKKISNIQYQGKNLLHLVNQLLTINRIESNQEKLNEVPILLKNFLENVSSSFHSLASQNGINWQINMREVTEKPLLIDKEKIEKILLNLLSNAIKYTPKDGNVSLLVKTIENEKGNYNLHIKVEDSGIGIEKESLPLIFNRFYKNDNKKIPGSGIGLSLVKTIVKDLMKGQIEVESTLGKGSKFIVIIPNIKADISGSERLLHNEAFVLPMELTSQLESSEETIFVSEKTDKKNTILIVEDNITLLNSLSERLSNNFNVLSVTSAEEALEILQEEDIDIVISDIMLPGKSGKELCAEIKSNIVTSHIAVILITAIQQQEVKMESLELGADNYLTKPFSHRELQLRISNILRRQKNLRQLYKRDALPEKAENRFNKFDDDLLHRINSYIEKNLSNPEYSIENLSEDVALSRVHLYRKMKKLLDISPSKYMRDFRLKKAAEILSKEDVRVVELADLVGFQDANYFLKCFKEKYGISPKEFSKKGK
ncbi:ATPase/histidine kinase/DNA gyrase B/HSP90 domain protein [Capnocytophaga cynodegmi]|nr:ATPase/histidine kinase/DNA gyrase B/HSP90 domain protein [Capnocytophaga cynodegmi]